MSVACNSMDFGIVKRACLAAPTLTQRRNFFGYSTGIRCIGVPVTMRRICLASTSAVSEPSGWYASQAPSFKNTAASTIFGNPDLIAAAKNSLRREINADCKGMITASMPSRLIAPKVVAISVACDKRYSLIAMPTFSPRRARFSACFPPSSGWESITIAIFRALGWHCVRSSSHFSDTSTAWLNPVAFRAVRRLAARAGSRGLPCDTKSNGKGETSGVSARARFNVFTRKMHRPPSDLHRSDVGRNDFANSSPAVSRPGKVSVLICTIVSVVECRAICAFSACNSLGATEMSSEATT